VSIPLAAGVPELGLEVVADAFDFVEQVEAGDCTNKNAGTRPAFDLRS
jgi:hypothetical protein